MGDGKAEGSRGLRDEAIDRRSFSYSAGPRDDHRTGTCGTILPQIAEIEIAKLG